MNQLLQRGQKRVALWGIGGVGLRRAILASVRACNVAYRLHIPPSNDPVRPAHTAMPEDNIMLRKSAER